MDSKVYKGEIYLKIMRNSRIARIGGLVALLSGIGCAAIASRGHEDSKTRIVFHKLQGTYEERAEQRLRFHREAKDDYEEIVRKYGLNYVVKALANSPNNVYLE